MELWNDYYHTVLKPAMQKLSKCTTGQTCTISEHCFKNFPRLTPAKFHYPGNQKLLNAVRPGYENISN